MSTVISATIFSMEVIEQFIQSKTGNPENGEDSIVSTPNFIAVIDGATSKSGRLWNGKTSGKVASELLTKAIKQLPPDVEAPQAMQALNQSIVDWYTSEGIFELMRENTVERATSTVIMYSRQKRQVWVVGDSQAMIDDRLFTHPKPIDTLFENLRAFFLEIELMKGKSIQDLITHDTGRDLVQPLIALQTHLQNPKRASEFAYHPLDGFLEDMSTVTIIDVPARAHQVVLASDGYPFLKKTLEASEQALAELLREDPLCFRKFRSVKGLRDGNVSYDDRSYIRFTVGE